MADEKKTEASTKPKAAAKPAAAKPAAKPAAAKAAKPAKAAGSTAPKTARSKATPAVTDGPTCKVEGCKQGVRAKGFCRKHFMGWRRGGLGDHHRYKICSKEACRKPRVKGGLCAEHAGSGEAAAAAPAAG
jgi:hypothetical protein